MTSRECDDCRTTAEALASGFDPVESGEWVDLIEPCTDPTCRNYVAGGQSSTAIQADSDHASGIETHERGIGNE